MEVHDCMFLMIQVLLVACCENCEGLMVKEEIGRLHCRTGVTLNIYPDGKVNGSSRDGGKLEIKLHLDVKGTTLYGIHSKRYLCMTTKGKLRGEVEKSKHCYFRSIELPYHFTAFHGKRQHSRKLFIGLTRNGKPRAGHLKNRRSHFSWSKKRTKRRNDKKLNYLTKSRNRKILNLFIRELSIKMNL